MPQNSCISRVTTKTSSLVHRAWWGMAGFKDLACFTKQKHKARYILSHKELIIWFFKIPCDLAVGSCGGQGVPKCSFSLFLLLLMWLKYNEFRTSMCRIARGDPLQTTKWLRCCGCSRFLFCKPFLQQTPQNVWQRVWRNSSAKAGMGKHNKEDTFRFKVWLWVPKNGIFSRQSLLLTVKLLLIFLLSGRGLKFMSC